MGKSCRLLLLVVLLLLLAPGIDTIHAAPASNNTNRSHPGETGIDTDGDGDPDLVELRREFTGDDQTDTILIVDTEDRLPSLENWREATEYDGVRVVYDARSDGTAEVIVDFQRRQGRWSHVAHVYDSDNRTLSYETMLERGLAPADDSESLPSLEEMTPTTTVKSAHPWVRQGRVSYDLEVVCPPGVRCSFDEPNYDRSGNVTIRVADDDGDGEPDREVRQVDTDVSQLSAVMRTQLMVSKRSELTLDPSDGVLWPYLGSTTDRGYVRPDGLMYPPIQVDWETGTIHEVSEFVASRGDEDNYFIYSFGEINPRGVVPPSFEFPFSFYDLADDNDGIPELQIRMVAYAQGSYFGLDLLPQTLPFPFAQSRYSWDQNNDGRWDYKIAVTGTNAYTDVTKIGPYRLRMPSYRVLPDWVLSHRWQGASFVHATDGFRSSEGIYTGDFNESMRRDVLGLETTPGPLFEGAPSGYRLEANGDYGARPKLYYSPVDRGLHLYGLDYGVWNRSGRRATVHYENADSDPFVDRWQLGNGETASTLVAENNTLVYADAGRLSFKRTSIDQSDFVTQPPKTTAEWRQLRSRLNRSGSVSGDLRAIFRRYDGEPVTVTNATFTDYVPTERGFRVFTTLSADSRVTGTDTGNATKSLTLPTERQVVFVFADNGARRSVEVVPATPPALSIENVSLDRTNSIPLERSEIVVSVRNEGWETAENVSIELVDGQTTVANTSADVAGKQSENVRLEWWPQSDRGDLRLLVRGRDGKRVSERVSLQVDRRETPSVLDRFQVGNRTVPLSLGAAFATVIGLVLTARRVL